MTRNLTPDRKTNSPGNKALLFMLLFACVQVMGSGSVTVHAEPPGDKPAAVAPALATIEIAPRGPEFPLGLYSVEEPAKFPELHAQAGWNIFHSYHDSAKYLHAAETHSAGLLLRLPGSVAPIPHNAHEWIESSAKSRSVFWWDLPEERRYWIPREKALIVEYAALTRRLDPQQRPTYMYIPGHYTASQVAQYVPYIDIVPSSVYRCYRRHPAGWTRWRMEETLQGITLAGSHVGTNYLRGEKFPVAIIEMFHYQGADPLTAAGSTHDFWQSIVSGARGVLIFSYAHRTDRPEFEAPWQALNAAAALVSGPEKLGRMILEGERLNDVDATVLVGEPNTAEFLTTPFEKEPIRFPACNVLAINWRHATYVIAVSSADSPSQVEISGMPAGETTFVSLNRPNAPPVRSSNGSLTLDFEPLGVWVLKSTPAK